MSKEQIDITQSTEIKKLLEVDRKIREARKKLFENYPQYE